MNTLQIKLAAVSTINFYLQYETTLKDLLSKPFIPTLEDQSMLAMSLGRQPNQEEVSQYQVECRRYLAFELAGSENPEETFNQLTPK